MSHASPDFGLGERGKATMRQPCPRTYATEMIRRYEMTSLCGCMWGRRASNLSQHILLCHGTTTRVVICSRQHSNCLVVRETRDSPNQFSRGPFANSAICLSIVTILLLMHVHIKKSKHPREASDSDNPEKRAGRERGEGGHGEGGHGEVGVLWLLNATV
ncbi:hypothetical protein BC938DRAFT_482648 [Jimgerdemannia flammicorona]|uniref:Uncharacterized protein n=1 Tax=Jimgerdemannia flammicorona TaxID=994334 RepID=A0A433QWC6_9FUNG|nr:hypothetical protein BC938DRAFT_482648 [Jimgerdemannia flammicorona]